MKKFAFTLAELLISLTIIGIIAAIVFPAALRSAPDEEIAKFKKSYADFGKAIYQLANTDEFFSNGDFGIKNDHTNVDDARYFCKSLASILTVNDVNCSDSNLGYKTSMMINMTSSDVDTTWSSKKADQYLDCMCKNHTEAGSEIKFNNGVVWYSVNPAQHFATLFSGSTQRIFKRSKQRYKIFCIDIDGIGNGEDPFGIGVSVDGRIYNGLRVKRWLNKDLAGKETTPETIPADISCSNDSVSLSADISCPAGSSPNAYDECDDGIISNGQLMILRYNVGDSILISNNVEIKSTDETYSAITTPACWRGTTSDSCNNTMISYNGCSRTVCNWLGAKKSCEALIYGGYTDWRLPTKDEIASISTAKLKELLLCSSSDSSDFSKCISAAKCSGASSNTCYPSYVWTSTASGSSYYKYNLSGSSWSPSAVAATSAASVRCVR